MFDLDAAVAQWRRQMVDGGIATPDVLNELECHLRDEAEEQLRAGSEPRQAFEAAVERLGHANALKAEFRRAGGLQEAWERAKQIILTLAGVPQPILVTTMNTSHAEIEPRWATYVKGAVFLVPAIVLWALSVVFVFPKLQQICRDAGVAIPGIYGLVNYISDHSIFVCGAVIVALAFLEGRFSQWPKYRRATVGAGVFLLNSAIMILIFVMVVLALLAVPGLRGGN